MKNKQKKALSEENENPFTGMGMITFWGISFLFWMCFPASIILPYVMLGSVRTKQLIKALVHDFLQTIFIIFAVLSIIMFQHCSEPFLFKYVRRNKHFCTYQHEFR